MRTLRLLAAASALSLLAATSHQAHAQPAKAGAVEDARVHFQRGVDLFTERNFGAALVEFRRANESAPNYRLLYNIGQTCHELSDYVCAIQAFQDYLAKGGKELAEQRVAEVEDAIKRLRARVGTIVVTTSVAGAEIQLDDQVVGTSPLATPITVSAGRRRLSATKAGYSPLAKVVEVAGGDSTTVTLTFDAPAAKPEAPGAAAPKEAAPAGHPVPTGVWIGVGLTAALTAGAVVTGVFAGRAHSDYAKALDTFPTTASAIDDAATKTRTLSIAGDVLAGSAVVSGALTLILGLTLKDSGPAHVGVAAGPTSLGVHGRF
jgi:tetratricopeptide (TPR) repeat protein